MSSRRALLAAAAAVAVLAAALPIGASAQQEDVIPSIELRGELTPAQADWIGHAMTDAAGEYPEFAIIRLDTPGGLDSSAEEIVDTIRTASIPVVVYVSPGGAEVGGARLRDRRRRRRRGDGAGTTLEFEGNDLGENTALKQGRIDMIAADQETLLEKLDGYEVAGPKATTLSTAGAEIDDRSMSIPFQVMTVLVDPDVAYLLLLIGLLGLLLEAFAPGTIIPGAIGAVALVLGLIGAIQLPVAAVGVVLLIAGAALIVAEANLPTGGGPRRARRRRADRRRPAHLRHPDRPDRGLAAVRGRRRLGPRARDGVRRRQGAAGAQAPGRRPASRSCSGRSRPCARRSTRPARCSSRARSGRRGSIPRLPRSRPGIESGSRESTGSSSSSALSRTVPVAPGGETVGSEPEGAS